MDYNKWIADLEPGDEIEGFYILKTAQIKTSNSGKPFLAAGIADRSGTVDAKFWDYAGPLGPQDEGTQAGCREESGEKTAENIFKIPPIPMDIADHFRYNGELSLVFRALGLKISSRKKRNTIPSSRSSEFSSV